MWITISFEHFPLIYQKILQEIAQKNRTTPQEVEMAMREAIEAAYVCPDPEIRKRLQEIPCVGTAPTPEEFIAYVAKELCK